MSRLKIKLEKNRTIKSPVIDVTSDYKKIIICKTTKEFLHPRKDELREIFRNAFENYQTTDNQVIIDKHFITISSNMTNYSIDRFKDDIRLINKMLNKRILYKYHLIENKRHYKKSPDRIVFYQFYEQSNEKELTHCHMILKVPKILEKKLDVVNQSINQVIKDLQIQRRRKKYYLKNKSYFKKFSTELSTRSPEIVRKYPTKMTTVYNDNFEVF